MGEGWGEGVRSATYALSLAPPPSGGRGPSAMPCSFLLCLDLGAHSRLDAFTVKRGNDFVASLESCFHLSEFPVAEPGFNAAFDEGVVAIEHQHMVAWHQGRCRYTQDVVPTLDH